MVAFGMGARNATKNQKATKNIGRVKSKIIKKEIKQIQIYYALTNGKFLQFGNTVLKKQKFRI